MAIMSCLVVKDWVKVTLRGVYNSDIGLGSSDFETSLGGKESIDKRKVHGYYWWSWDS